MIKGNWCLGPISDSEVMKKYFCFWEWNFTEYYLFLDKKGRNESLDVGALFFIILQFNIWSSQMNGEYRDGENGDEYRDESPEAQK